MAAFNVFNILRDLRTAAVLISTFTPGVVHATGTTEEAGQKTVTAKAVSALLTQRAAAPRPSMTLVLKSAFTLTNAIAAEPARVTDQRTTELARIAVLVPPTTIAPQLSLTLGKSSVLRLPEDVTRISVGSPEIADVMLLNPNELYLLGKKIGATNIFLWTGSGGTTIMDVSVDIDTTALRNRLNLLMPNEKTLTVSAAGESLVLSGQVADAVKVHHIAALAEQFGGKKVINMMTTRDAAQVMLEVKVAEVSKTLIDKLGASFTGTRTSGDFTYSLITNLLTGAAGTVSATRAGGGTSFSLDAQIQNGLVKILAEPTIMAISGQEGAFLAGGKIFIPVPQASATGGVTVTLQEESFGIGLKFTPTVLDGGRINLRVTPEVSELSKVGTSVSANGVVSVLPTITTRRASTTVQLYDGQSFAIGGLIKDNVTQAVSKFPILGEIPILGALFRSSEYQRDMSELLFVITPRLVRTLPPDYALPTDGYVDPSRSEFFLEGLQEGKPKAGTPAGDIRRGGQVPQETRDK